MTWDLGEVVPLQTTVKVNGALTAATVALSVTAPDGTASTPAVANPSLGLYTAKVTADQAGTWTYVWTASGAVDTAKQPGQFDVEPLTARLISLDSAKAHLNISTTTNDEELRELIDSITAVVETYVGPVVPQTKVETVNASGGTLVLGHPPVLSLTSITAPQTWIIAPLLADLILEGPTGLVYHTAGTVFPTGRLTVTYRAGRNPVPPAIRTAAKIILAHAWETQRGGSGTLRVGGALPDDLQDFGAAWTVPNRAKEYLAPYMRAPAVA